MRSAAIFFSVMCIFVVIRAYKASAECMSCLSKTGDSYTELACTGDSEYEVIHKCGSPDYTEDGETVTTGRYGSDKSGKGRTQGGFGVTTERIRRFYYNCGQGRFINILVFKSGILIDIQEGDRGSGDQKCW